MNSVLTKNPLFGQSLAIKEISVIVMVHWVNLFWIEQMRSVVSRNVLSLYEKIIIRI